MKILFAVSNEKISGSIIKKYESIYKEIISSKNVYYFNAILKELQKDKTYDRIVISEDLEPFSNKNYATTDNFIFEKLDRISDEAVDNSGEDIPIILITADRRVKGEAMLNKLFGIGLYSALIGPDRTMQNLCDLIFKPRTKKEAKIYYRIDANDIDYKAESESYVSENEIQSILAHYKKLGKNEEKYVESFDKIANQYSDKQLKVIIRFLPIGVKAVLEAKSPKYQQIATFSGESNKIQNQKPYASSQINPKTNQPRNPNAAVTSDGIMIESIQEKDFKKPTKPVIIPATLSTQNVKKFQRDGNGFVQVNRPQQQAPQQEQSQPQQVQQPQPQPSVETAQENANVNVVEEPMLEFEDTFSDAVESNVENNKEQIVDNINQTNENEINNTNVTDNTNDVEMNEFNDVENINETNQFNPINEIENTNQQNEIDSFDMNDAEQKRGRGRPRKILTPEELAARQLPKRGRGRPRKNINGFTTSDSQLTFDQTSSMHTENTDSVMPGIENNTVEQDTGMLPGFGNEVETPSVVNQPAQELPMQQQTVQPPVQQPVQAPTNQNVNNNNDNNQSNGFLPGFEVGDDDNFLMFDEPELPGFEEIENNANNNKTEYKPDTGKAFNETFDNQEMEDILGDLDEGQDDEEKEDYKDKIQGYVPPVPQPQPQQPAIQQQPVQPAAQQQPVEQQGFNNSNSVDEFNEFDDDDDLFGDNEDDGDSLLQNTSNNNVNNDFNNYQINQDDEVEELDFLKDDDDDISNLNQQNNNSFNNNNNFNNNNYNNNANSVEFEDDNDNEFGDNLITSEDESITQAPEEPELRQIINYNNQPDEDLSNLLTADKKIVAFVGTTKNGTSFLVNNLADVFSKQGVRTAILDLTKNRNSYYIYTKNEEELRKVAAESITKLAIGTAQGIRVDNYLDVYTAIPGEDNQAFEEYNKVLATLLRNYSLVLLDCDFNTDYGYLRAAQELYLVQSMDVLTIQPLTAYLRDLKAKTVLDQDKIRIVINKFTRVRSVTEKTIIGGMAFYNDPSMSFMTELFNREKVRYAVVPFDVQAYSKYLEGLTNCVISINGYTKDFINSLRKLASMVYPMVSGNGPAAKPNKFNDLGFNKYSTNNNNTNFNNTFSSDINDTLDKMKKY